MICVYFYYNYIMIFNTLFNRLFNKVTLTKVFIIFVVGLFSRVFVNYFYGVNVFVDYTNLISLYYYGFMSLFVVFISEVVSYFELDIFALFGYFIGFIFRFIMSFIYSLCNLFGHLLFGERYFTLGNVPKSFDGKDVTNKGISTLQRNGEDGDRIRSNRRGLSRGKPGSAAVGGLYGSDVRRPHSAALECLYGDHSGHGRSGNVDQSEFNEEIRRSRHHRRHSDRNPVDISTAQGLYGYPRDGYDYSRWVYGYGGYAYGVNGVHGCPVPQYYGSNEVYGHPVAQNQGVYELPNNDVGIRHELPNNQAGGSYVVGHIQLSNVRRHELDGYPVPPVGHNYGRHESHNNDVNRSVTTNSRRFRESRVSDESSTLLGEIPEGQIEGESSRIRAIRGYYSVREYVNRSHTKSRRN